MGIKKTFETKKDKTYIRKELSLIDANDIKLFVFVFDLFNLLAGDSFSPQSNLRDLQHAIVNIDLLAMSCR